MDKRFRYSPGSRLITHSSGSALQNDIDIIAVVCLGILWGAVVFGLRAIWITLITCVTAVAVSAIIRIVTKSKNGYINREAVICALLVSMMTPVTSSLAIPLVTGVVAGFLTEVLGKWRYGSMFNPVMIATAVRIVISGKEDIFVRAGERINSIAFNIDISSLKAVQDPVQALSAGNVPGISVYDTFIGNGTGFIGTASVLITVIGGIYLIARKVITWHIPVSYFVICILLAYLFPQAGTSTDSVLYSVMGMGSAAAAFLVLTYRSSSPLSGTGMILYGAVCAGAGFAVRYLTGDPYGLIYGNIFATLLVPATDSIGLLTGKIRKAREKTRENSTENDIPGDTADGGDEISSKES